MSGPLCSNVQKWQQMSRRFSLFFGPQFKIDCSPAGVGSNHVLLLLKHGPLNRIMPVITQCNFNLGYNRAFLLECKLLLQTVLILKLSWTPAKILILWQHCRWLGLGKDSIFTQNRLNMSRHLVHKHFMVWSKTNIERKVTFSNVVTELTSLSSAPAPLSPDAVVNVTHHIMGHVF